MNKIEYKDIIAFHPGYYLKDLIEAFPMKQEELASRLNTSAKTVSALVNGNTDLTDEMACRLSIVFDTSPDLWLSLQRTYAEKKMRIAQSMHEESELQILKRLDYRFWVRLGFVADTGKSNEQIMELRRFLRISRLEILTRKNFLVQFRSSSNHVKETNIINSNAWVQTALNMGLTQEVNHYDRAALRHVMPEIRNMTTQDPDVFLPNLRALLANCGVSFVLLPHLKNSGVNGAVRWIGKEKVILAINDRQKYADVFWFSLFHEIGHVLQKRITSLIVAGLDENSGFETDLMKRLEAEADSFAKNMLIPEKQYRQFVARNDFTKANIIQFADNAGIHPGIVVGRLQKDHLLAYNTRLNALKIKYSVPG